MADQAGGQLWREEHGVLAGLDVATAESGHGATARFGTNRGGVLQVRAVAAGRVPVVALHAVVVLGDHRTANRMPRAVGRAEKSVRIAVDVAGTLGGHLGAFGVNDALVEIQRRRFRFQGQFRGLGHIDGPGVVQIQIRQLAGHQLRIRQTVAGVFGGVLGDVQRRRHGLLNSAGAGIGGAGVAFAVA